MLVLLSLRVSGGVDALGRRKACCRRAVTLVDLLLLLCATRKDCSLLCAMRLMNDITAKRTGIITIPSRFQQ